MAESQTLDLALLKLNGYRTPVLSPAENSYGTQGETVYAIGNPIDLRNSVSRGIISGFEGGFLKTDAKIYPGNSGGPLVNLAGEVIGITSAKIAQVGVEGMGYAISIDTACPIIKELVNNGYVIRPWLGVGLYTVDQIAIRQLDLGIDRGVVLLEIVPDGPAAQAGLMEADVIVKIGGEDIVNVWQDGVLILTDVLADTDGGDELRIGDGSGSRQAAALYDWVVWRTDGAFTPEEEPIPADLTQ